MFISVVTNHLYVENMSAGGFYDNPNNPSPSPNAGRYTLKSPGILSSRQVLVKRLTEISYYCKSWDAPNFRKVPILTTVWGWYRANVRREMDGFWESHVRGVLLCIPERCCIMDFDIYRLIQRFHENYYEDEEHEEHIHSLLAYLEEQNAKLRALHPTKGHELYYPAKKGPCRCMEENTCHIAALFFTRIVDAIEQERERDYNRNKEKGILLNP